MMRNELAVLDCLEEAPDLVQLLWLARSVLQLPLLTETLVGDWTAIKGGQCVNITWIDPYREEAGYLFFLPGIKEAFIHVPHAEEDGKPRWYTLKHLAIFASKIEMDTEPCRLG